jgi:tetratricopeptide (TPR) repeat protein
LLAKNYAQAEQSFERFLSRTANVADWPRIEILEVKLGLVQAYKCQAKYADAKAILEPCLALEGIHKSQKLSMMHTLAELYYLLEDYPTAKDHAATVARRRSRVFGPKSDIYYESVALLTMVLYKLDKTEDAEILQSRIHAEHPLHRMIRGML